MKDESGKERDSDNNQTVTQEQKKAAEDEIRRQQRDVDYDTKEYPVEVIVNKYMDGLDTDSNELFVPDYQRDETWSEDRQSKFIESVLIGLPIPYLFVADVHDEDEDKDARLEIVDGSQRIRTLAKFQNNELTLCGLKKLILLNGFRFADLPPPRQRRFKRRTLRMIELTERAVEEVRRDIFERINTGSDALKDMEKRRGIQQGPMLTLVERCAQMPLFAKLAPLTPTQEARKDRQELVLRFFTYRYRYKTFKNRVAPLLDEYLEEMNQKDPQELVPLEREFTQVLAFVEKHFEFGFAKKAHHKKTPRVRFEAIAVGAALALAIQPALVPPPTDRWLTTGTKQLSEFEKLTTSGSSNSRPRVEKRIEYVRDRLLGRPSR